ncbi:MAG TPA: PhnD/SsuA/transferrin family substrate-binding protein [Acidimicrobiia bacterium]|nr:PhnD/SsuA/transferrin family substrate-binding protein [Acidimicrobiia bacterium]
MSPGVGEKGLRVGTFLAPNMLPVYQAVTKALGEGLGTEAVLVVETDYENCRNDVNDICFVCSLPYVQFERMGIAPGIPVAAPVLQGDRYGGRPIYFSDVIVHADSTLSSFADLRGRSWAYNEPLSQSGYGITRHHLVTLGETNGYFGRVVEAGFHETAIQMIADRSVDAAAIDSQVLAVAMREDRRLADSIRVIASLGPSTIQPVAVSKRFDEEFRQRVREILVGLHLVERLRPVLDHGLIDRFTAVGPEDYDDIRSMLDACERAGYMVIR